MKSTLVAAGALVLAAGTASAALNAYKTGGVSLPYAVRLVDGSVLPAGSYELEIHFKGYGNAAEFWFFKGNVLKGKAHAEARGFKPQPPGAAASGEFAPKIDDIKGDSAGVDKSTDPKLKKVEVEAIKKVDPAGPVTDKYPAADKHFANEKWKPVAGMDDWERGFAQGVKGKVLPTGQGTLKISFDSSNSAAGFNAILPYIETRSK